MLLPKVGSAHRRHAAAGALAASMLLIPSTAIVANAAPQTGAQQVAADNVELVEVSSIPFETKVVEVDTLPKDVEVVKQEGADGVAHVYASRAHTLGAPVRTTITVKDQTPRIIEVGTKIELPVVEEPEVVEPEPEEENKDDKDSVEASRGDSGAVEPSYNASTAGQYSLGDLMFQGVIHWGGYKFTYYSQSVLPGGGLAIPGRHVSDAGFVSDGAGNVVLAAGAGVPHGSTFSIPFGSGVGKVYDTCGSCSPTWLDVYTR